MSTGCRHVHVRPHCFILTEAYSSRLELAYFARKISKNRLVCKNAVTLAHYGSYRLLSVIIHFSVFFNYNGKIFLKGVYIFLRLSARVSLNVHRPRPRLSSESCKESFIALWSGTLEAFVCMLPKRFRHCKNKKCCVTSQNKVCET